MIYYNPPHEPQDEEKLQSMIKTLKSGGHLPPVIVCGNDAFTGSHRIAAWDACEMDCEIVSLSDKEYILAVSYMNGIEDLAINNPDDMEFFHKHLDTDVNDYNLFCEGVLNTSQNEYVLNAVKDQIY